MPEQQVGYIRVSTTDQNTPRERALIRERQREGIELAKARGAYRGRRPALSPHQAKELKRRAEAGEPVAKLAREFGVSRETAYLYQDGHLIAGGL